jgi:hypothetical protein
MWDVGFDQMRNAGCGMGNESATCNLPQIGKLNAGFAALQHLT